MLSSSLMSILVFPCSITHERTQCPIPHLFYQMYTTNPDLCQLSARVWTDTRCSRSRYYLPYYYVNTTKDCIIKSPGSSHLNIGASTARSQCYQPSDDLRFEYLIGTVITLTSQAIMTLNLFSCQCAKCFACRGYTSENIRLFC